MKKIFKNIRIVAIIILLIALADMPYYYYQLLRWIICGVAIYSAYLATQYVSTRRYKFDGKDSGWTIIFIVIAILYNPISSIGLDRSMWAILDIVTAIIIWVSISKLGYKLMPATRKYE